MTKSIDNQFEKGDLNGKPERRKIYPMAYVAGVSSGITGAPGWILTYIVLKGTYKGILKPVFKKSKSLVNYIIQK